MSAYKRVGNMYFRFMLVCIDGDGGGGSGVCVRLLCVRVFNKQRERRCK